MFTYVLLYDIIYSPCVETIPFDHYFYFLNIFFKSSNGSKRLSEDLPSGTDREWGIVRMRSEKFRKINAWLEFRDTTSQAVFYYNEDTGHYQLMKPGPVLENEMRKRAWALVRRQAPDEWAMLHERSEVLRSVLQYDEMRDEVRTSFQFISSFCCYNSEIILLQPNRPLTHSSLSFFSSSTSFVFLFWF